MEHLINRQLLVAGNCSPKKTNGTATSKVSSQFRKLALSCFLFTLFFNATYAQTGKRDITHKLRTDFVVNTKNEVKKVPVMTVNQFSEDFDKVSNVTWKVEAGFNEADFMMDGKSMMAFYNFDNELLGSGYYVDYAALPEKGRDRIAKDYGDYIPEKAMYYDDAEADDDDPLNFFGNALVKDAYFVLLRKKDANKDIVVQVDKDGQVAYFSNVKKHY